MRFRRLSFERRPAPRGITSGACRTGVSALSGLLAFVTMIGAGPTAARGQSEPLTCGVPAVRTLRAGATDSFAFSVGTGERLLVEAAGLSGQIGLIKLRAINSTGSVEQCSGSLEVRGSSGPTTIEVSDCFGSEAGDYTITANVISDSAGNCARNFECGLTPSAMEVFGATLGYGFVGSGGEQVKISVTELGSTARPARLRIFGPDGSLLTDPHACGGMLTLTLPTTGFYTTLVSSCASPELGPLTLRREADSCPAGPVITHVGLAQGDDTPLLPERFDGNGRPIYVRQFGHSFSIIVEAQPGKNERPVAANAFQHDPSSPTVLPDVQILLGRPIGFGTPTVCDGLGPQQGGVPAVSTLEFDGSQKTANAINDFGCRFNDGSGSPRGRNSPLDACTRKPVTRDFDFVDAESTIQFCAPIAATWAFPPGDTVVRARARDASGNYGAPAEMLVRITSESSFLLGDLAAAELTTVDRYVYFTASETEHGTELWRSDGTAQGTVLVGDLNPGPTGSVPFDLTPLRDGICYVTDEPPNVLWHNSQPVPNLDISPAVATGLPLTKVGNNLYFFVGASGQSLELWRTNGASNAQPIRTISAGSVEVDSAATLRNHFFFTVRDAARDVTELWRSDGSDAGTDVILELEGSEIIIDELTASGELLYFVVGDPSGSFALWRSNGTMSGTARVKPFDRVSGSRPMHLTNVATTLFFTAATANTGTELWRSNGTEPSTRLVVDLRPGPAGSNPSGLTELSGRLLFAATDGQQGTELWSSDGTAVGTTMVEDIRPGSQGSNPTNLANVNGTLLFAADDGNAGSELWMSDGTAIGTTLALDIEPGSAGSVPDTFTLLHPSVATRGAVLFRARHGARGTALWGVPYVGRVRIAGCPGDCDGNRAVNIAELVQAVSSTLRGLSANLCAQADTDLSGRVSIDEVVTAVQAALEGCY